MTLELGARPGKPRDVRSGRGWFVDHPDGTVSRVIRRTAESGIRYGIELAFHADTDEAALAEYDAWSAEQNENNVARARRSAKWGPLGKGKM